MKCEMSTPVRKQASAAPFSGIVAKCNKPECTSAFHIVKGDATSACKVYVRPHESKFHWV
jgi:hypothetical protein